MSGKKGGIRWQLPDRSIPKAGAGVLLLGFELELSMTQVLTPPPSLDTTVVALDGD